MLEATEIIELFFKHLEIKNIPLGEVIFKEGEKGNTMFALIEGEVELFLNDKVVEIIYKNDVFGEGALVQLNHIRFTTAIAKTDCQIAGLNKEKFLFLLQETPLFALDILRSLSSRLYHSLPYNN
ncbi:MAG: cyclic nucleotide-binding domain-containing protein [Cyanobacteria bacterium]|nr:cyclic nucleotide-binding domain-containing protein [Cyanobacteria bacterium CG_2015-16_32_12]NCO78209.1 cyclic nucleotide-binding domain-containing protein [Cyanobacteria bacterium CG_2015-22_32_23]NCQ03934.1 cyclic nucleotide-binding domain-containing protein [Cyanobacteria bacterium CG_2015-09_32_10]NCQ41935.1 cyclic nucleotide-binding domain-containing protein [Cyanobacteria bacterium CG_2015-04_32_10]NCS85834.1 cyclic nucleotide-binding domain-containing protein [Cyanobacteria bacterium